MAKKNNAQIQNTGENIKVQVKEHGTIPNVEE
jgi:hypothetical protein